MIRFASALTAPDEPIIGSHNIVTSTTLSATSSQTNYPVINLTNPNTSVLWKSDVLTAQYLTVLCDGAGTVDYLAVARHNFGSEGIELSIEGRTTSGGSFTTLVSAATPDDDEPIMFKFAPNNYYEVRLKMAASSEKPQAAVLYCGLSLTMERGIWVGHTPIPHARRQNKVGGWAESGDFLGGPNIIGEYRETSAKFMHLGPDWYRTYMDPFLDEAQEEPFFFFWRPDAYPAEGGFVSLINDPMPVPTEPSHLIEVELQMRGVA